MLQFLKGRKFKLFVLVICALLLGSVLSVVSENAASPVTRAVSVVFSPLGKLADAVADRAENLGSYFKSSGTYKSENERLKQKLADYENQLVEYNDIKSKLESYETMLGIKEENPDYELSLARVVGTDKADMFSSLIIDKGSAAGISVNDPVVNGEYLVGIVKKVNPYYSVVETLLSPEINVSALESKTREVAYVTTTIEESKNERALMKGLDRTTAITPGGIILTSGIGGVYPKGLIIGTVAEIGESSFELSSYAVIEPGADIKSLENVFIITSFAGQGIEEIIE